jgi:hypothetical protein
LFALWPLSRRSGFSETRRIAFYFNNTILILRDSPPASSLAKYTPEATSAASHTTECLPAFDLGRLMVSTFAA